jgi:hypothetical protein
MTHPPSILLACEHARGPTVASDRVRSRRRQRGTPMMTSVILLLSLLTPNSLEQYANELLVPDRSEPRCDEIERMFAKFDAEYRVERMVAEII